MWVIYLILEFAHYFFQVKLKLLSKTKPVNPLSSFERAKFLKLLCGWTCFAYFHIYSSSYLYLKYVENFYAKSIKLLQYPNCWNNPLWWGKIKCKITYCEHTRIPGNGAEPSVWVACTCQPINQGPFVVCRKNVKVCVIGVICIVRLNLTVNKERICKQRLG